MEYDYTKIKQLRESKGMTPSEFARQLGAKRQNVALWEAGINAPQISTLLKICTVFKVRLSFFVK